MAYVAIKVLLTAVIVVAISESAKRSTLVGALLASLPLTSLLAFIWLYIETGDTARIASLSSSIFWYVLPSLVLFLAFPQLTAQGFGFWPALAISIALTVAAYGVMLWLLTRAGITI